MLQAMRDRMEEQADDWLAEKIGKEVREAITGELEYVLELIEGYVDVRDGSDGRPLPNNAMLATQTLRELIVGVKS